MLLSLGYFNNVLNGWYLGGSIGFCYDPCTDDYKLLAFGSKFIVMSLKTKCWKSVKFSYDIMSASDGPVVEGRLHWRVVLLGGLFRLRGDFMF